MMNRRARPLGAVPRDGGYRPIEVASGREALELMRSGVPDVIDVRIADLSGQDVSGLASRQPCAISTIVAT
jgi:hypothetical protein